MGVYVKNMKMPKACVYREDGQLTTCPLYDIDGYCGVLNTEANHKENDMPSNCPLIELPPHGDLIDRTELKDKIYHTSFCDPVVDWDDICRAPVIIESEEEQ